MKLRTNSNFPILPCVTSQASSSRPTGDQPPFCYSATSPWHRRPGKEHLKFSIKKRPAGIPYRLGGVRPRGIVLGPSSRYSGPQPHKGVSCQSPWSPRSTSQRQTQKEYWSQSELLGGRSSLFYFTFILHKCKIIIKKKLREISAVLEVP